MAHSRVIQWAKPFEEGRAMDEEWEASLTSADLDGF